MMESPNTRGRRDIPNLSEVDDQSIAMIAALASELVIVRERLDTLERLLVATTAISADAVDTFVADPEAVADRDRLRRRIIAKVFKPIRDAARRAAERVKEV